MLRQLKTYAKRFPSIVRLNHYIHRSLANFLHDFRDLCDSYILKSTAPRVTPYGFKLVGSSSVHHRAMQAGTFEPDEMQLIQEYLHKADGFVDIGANIGFYSCMGRHFGKQVVAIEPLQRNLALLYANMIVNDWTDVEVFPVGLSKKPGLAILYGASGTGASLIAGWAGASPQFHRTTPLSTLDIVLNHRFEGRKLIIKIDVEGVEYEVLLGGRKILGMSPRPVWMVEICLNEYHPGGVNPNYASTFELFWKHGYEVRTADRRRKIIKPEDVERWVHEKRCDSGVINYLFLPMRQGD